MNMNIFQVDAFASNLFSGNPASVCMLNTWLRDQLLQQIAAENNQAETAFLVIRNDRVDIRWFTPTIEVDLCGHATLAAAHILYQHYGLSGTITFNTVNSGHLPVWQEKDQIMLNFPSDIITEEPLRDEWKNCFSIQPSLAFRGKTDLMFVFETETEVMDLVPNLERIKKLPVRGVIVTAPGTIADFVSRFFAPQSGIPEDPVTGSAHTTLTPYWAARLGKSSLQARQLSRRGGRLICHHKDSRVIIGGHACTYMSGNANLPTLPAT